MKHLASEMSLSVPLKLTYVGPNALQQSNIYTALLIEMLCVLIYANTLPTDERLPMNAYR
jgi:hypothetical protein